MVLSFQKNVNQKNQNILLSVLSGILLSLPWLFSDLAWVLFFALVPLLFINNSPQGNGSQKIEQIFHFYFIAFLIWNLLSCWWISYVSLTGMLFVVIINALLMTIVWWYGAKYRRILGELSGLFVLLCFWLSFELLQHRWAVQWPWLTLGNSFGNETKLIQWYEFTGVLGGSMWVLVANFFLFNMFKHVNAGRFKQAFRMCFYVLIILGIPIVISLWIYSSTGDRAKDLEVVIVQPNIDPYTEKFAGMSDMEQLDRIIRLVESTVTESTELIIAPETSLPVMWEDSISERNSVGIAFAPILQNYPEIDVIGGCITKRKFKPDEEISKTAKMSLHGNFYFDQYNSALLLNGKNKMQIAHKRILVSGVEKMPFQEYFPSFGQLTINIGGDGGSLAAAERSTVFHSADSVIIGPVICFESAFGAHCCELIRSGARILVVITNDGWWKDSPGVWQHFGYARLKAIETRRSVVRSANTGISGFITEKGDVVEKSVLNTSCALRNTVSLNDKITFYVRYGDVIGWTSLILSIILLMYFLNQGLPKQADKA